MSPGTVSRILWHFPGGPYPDEGTNKQKATRKPFADAYLALKGILQSRSLRLGDYTENHKSSFSPQPDGGNESCRVDKTIALERVCCVADIPIIHLPYHARRYGRIAIGFHRQSVINNNFNPVLYQLNRSKAADDSFHAANNLQMAIDLAIQQNHVDILEKLKQSKSRLMALLSLTKSFDDSEFSTIYTEREWRSTKPFQFSFDDLAMIVVPKHFEGIDYLSQFIVFAAEIEIPRRIPIVSWEDLVEH